MGIKALRDLLPDVPSWQWRFQRKYHVRTMLRMNDLLIERGLTQKDVCEATGWKKSFVSRILSGEGNLTLRTIARFEDAVGGDVLLVAGPEKKARMTCYRVEPIQHLDRALHTHESVEFATPLRAGEFVPAANDHSYSLSPDA